MGLLKMSTVASAMSAHTYSSSLSALPKITGSSTTIAMKKAGAIMAMDTLRKIRAIIVGLLVFLIGQILAMRRLMGKKKLR